MGKAIPDNSFLNSCEVLKVEGGRKIYKSEDGSRLYTWDSLHGEVEVFNNRGFHLGVIDPVTRSHKKVAVKGRRINV